MLQQSVNMGRKSLLSPFLHPDTRSQQSVHFLSRCYQWLDACYEELVKTSRFSIGCQCMHYFNATESQKIACETKLNYKMAGRYFHSFSQIQASLRIQHVIKDPNVQKEEDNMQTEVTKKANHSTTTVLKHYGFTSGDTRDFAFLNIKNNGNYSSDANRIERLSSNPKQRFDSPKQFMNNFHSDFVAYKKDVTSLKQRMADMRLLNVYEQNIQNHWFLTVKIYLLKLYNHSASYKHESIHREIQYWGRIFAKSAAAWDAKFNKKRISDDIGDKRVVKRIRLS